MKTLWPDEYEDERDARFINDRVHANIQKDGTFSVVPRIYGGVTTADELMRIAQVAVKYQVPMVKLTGGQRIDLLGIKKGDLPGVWRELGMPSGHAYTKAFRTCKSCVGTDFCRYGVGDSIALSQKIERRFQGVESPHKMKLATAGCPRNCSEAYVKDLGAVAIEGGRWEIYVGGAAGGSVRKGDLLCTVDTHDEVLRYMGRFMQYYREHGKYLERSYGFLERVGIDTLRKILVEDSLGICAHLDAEIQRAVDAYRDPWQEPSSPPITRSSVAPNSHTRWRSQKTMAETITAHTINLGSVSSIPVGQGRCYVVGSEEIAIFRQRDGQLFATQNRCPHRQGPLSEGVMGGGRVICPLHGHRFDLQDGAGSEPEECVQVYAVKYVKGEIFLRLPL